MKSAYASSGKIFEQASKLYSPGLYEQLHDVKQGELVVIPGTYDHIEKLLDTLKVPYETKSLAQAPKVNGAKVLFINCKSYEHIADKTKKELQDFVSVGGRMVTTDWSLGLVNQVFEKKLIHTKQTTDDVVEIQCGTDIARRLIGMNYAQCHPKWWLEGSSYVFEAGQGVIPLIESKEMKMKYGSSCVAAGFSYGEGEAIHFISHLELQRTRADSKADKEGLEEFLKKMGVSGSADLEDATVAELEAAYSSLNTLAYLCIPQPILPTEMKSVTSEIKNIGSMKSVKLA